MYKIKEIQGYFRFVSIWPHRIEYPVPKCVYEIVLKELEKKLNEKNVKNRQNKKLKKKKSLTKHTEEVQ